MANRHVNVWLDECIALCKPDKVVVCNGSQEERKALYVKAQRLAMAQLPWTPIAYGQPAVPARATVKNLVLDIDGSTYFDGVLPR